MHDTSSLVRQPTQYHPQNSRLQGKAAQFQHDGETQ